MDLKTSSRLLEKTVPLKGKKAAPEANLSCYAFLYGEIISYMTKNVVDSEVLEARLKNIGIEVGFRMNQLMNARDKPVRRPNTIIDCLFHTSHTFYKSTFGKGTEGIEKSNDSENQYMILEESPLPTRFFSPNNDCGNFMTAGIIEATLQSLSIDCNVASFSKPSAASPNNTVYVIKCNQDVKLEER